MPEGDTLHKVADALAPRLVGRSLEKVQLRGWSSSLSGEIVREVRAVGKNLLIELASGLVLRSHLGLHGSWHRYALHETWRRPRRQASMILWTRTDVFVCFNAKTSECLETRRLSVHPVGRLGPDLLADDVDLDEILRRARSLSGNDSLVVDTLLNQNVASGIGNVYKNEVLFLCGVHPHTPPSRLDDESLKGLYRSARHLMKSNLMGGIRTTTRDKKGRRLVDAPRHWVYGRAGRPCLQCGVTIQFSRLGSIPRSTYWCPQCQTSKQG